MRNKVATYLETVVLSLLRIGHNPTRRNVLLRCRISMMPALFRKMLMPTNENPHLPLLHSRTLTINPHVNRDPNRVAARPRVAMASKAVVVVVVVAVVIMARASGNTA